MSFAEKIILCANGEHCRVLSSFESGKVVVDCSSGWPVDCPATVQLPPNPHTTICFARLVLRVTLFFESVIRIDPSLIATKIDT